MLCRRWSSCVSSVSRLTSSSVRSGLVTAPHPAGPEALPANGRRATRRTRAVTRCTRPVRTEGVAEGEEPPTPSTLDMVREIFHVDCVQLWGEETEHTAAKSTSYAHCGWFRVMVHNGACLPSHFNWFEQAQKTGCNKKKIITEHKDMRAVPQRELAINNAHLKQPCLSWSKSSHQANLVPWTKLKWI